MESLVEKSSVSGPIIAETALDLFNAIEGLRKLLKTADESADVFELTEKL